MADNCTSPAADNLARLPLENHSNDLSKGGHSWEPCCYSKGSQTIAKKYIVIENLEYKWLFQYGINKYYLIAVLGQFYKNLLPMKCSVSKCK